MKKQTVEVRRIETNPEIGLSDVQLEQRINAKMINKTKRIIGKSYPEIFFKNFVNFFNLFVVVLAVLLIYCEKYMSLMFAVIYSANLIIGLLVDIRAHRLMAKLRIVTQDEIDVVRNGYISSLPTEKIVVDDIIILKAGQQVPVDGFLASGNIGVNESNLTGESLTIYKEIGDTVLSGSYIVSGEGRIRVDKVGKNSYINQLERTAKSKKAQKTEIKNSLDWFFRAIIIAVIVVAALGSWAIFKELQLDFKHNFGTFAGTLISMIPAGLYLLSSLTLTYGVLNLARKRAMVQDMYSIETLARSDVLCLDKTGTITDGTMEVVDFLPVGVVRKADLANIITNLINATNDTNATGVALKKAFEFTPTEKATYVCPFNSENKYAFATFSRFTYVLGAFECVHCVNASSVKSIVDNYTSKGFRVLVVGRSVIKEMGKKLSTAAEIVGVIVLQDHIKDDAKATLDWFKENDVAIRIISGDNALTVSEIARQVGVINSEKCISLEGMSIEEVKAIAKDYVVFGRVSPEQKEALVESIKAEGHTVAMTGDGVNDILALKKADCSIAMANGSDAAKNVSQLVMLDSNFSSLPSVVAEGRRVINNLQRTCSLFLVKTIFATALAFVFITLAFLGITTKFPYETNQLYLWEFMIIGLGSFFIALEPNAESIKPGFIKLILKKALPGAIMIIVSAIVIYLLYYLGSNGIVYTGVFNDTQFKTMLFIVFSILPLVHLYMICAPFSKYRLVVFLCACFFNVTLLVLSFVFQHFGIMVLDPETGKTIVDTLFGVDFTSLVNLNYLEVAIIIVVAASMFVLSVYTTNVIKQYIVHKKQNSRRGEYDD